VKKYIKISVEFNDIWEEFSRNQIILILINFADNSELLDYFIRKYYYSNKYRLNDDFKKITAYKDIFKDMREYDTKKGLHYNKIKYSTLKMIIDNNLNKRELLIILYFINLYRNNFSRTYNLKINKVLNEIFKSTKNSRQNRILFIETLDKLKNWNYTDGSKFINDYKIEDKYVCILLDKSKKTW